MNYEIVTTDDFDREVKKLKKKYHSFLDDLDSFKEELKKNPTMGDELFGNIRKVPMSIASKIKGKSGGARIITVTVIVDIENSDIYLLDIYDKSQQESISKKEILKLIEKNEIIL